MADEASLERLSIPGATLASLLHRFSAAPSDLDGLLFGRFFLLPPPEPTDDSPSFPSSSSSLIAAILTSYISSASPASFFDALGRADPRPLLPSPPSYAAPIGWFSARRRSSLRPSMRELAVSLSLHKFLAQHSPSSSSPPPPLVFLLLSSSAAPNAAVHTHEYRAFVLRPGALPALEPRTLRVVNIGPAFRAQYSAFSPELAALPLVPCQPREAGGGEGEGNKSGGERIGGREQPMLEALGEGFGMERLSRLAGPGPAAYTAELEDFYGKMLAKLEGLARLVEESSTRVLEQENRNLKLRSKLAGLE